MSIQLPPGGIVLGIGCDLIEVQRIRDAIERNGERFLGRVFTEEERAYCAAKAHPHKHLAARWAAKEAVSKCFTTGIGAELGWKSVSIYHGERAEPLVRLDERGSALLGSVGGASVQVTLSHTETTALAVAVVLGRPAAGQT